MPRRSARGSAPAGPARPRRPTVAAGSGLVWPQLDLAAHLEEADRRIDTLERAQRERRDGHHERGQSLGSCGHDDRSLRAGPARPIRARPPCSARTRPRPGGAHARRGGKTTAAPSGAPRASASSQSSAEEVALARPAASKRSGDGGPTIGRQRIAPSEVVERAVEGLATPGLDGAGHAAREERELLVLHHRSSPRPSRRRAMMLRWISELPP